MKLRNSIFFWVAFWMTAILFMPACGGESGGTNGGEDTTKVDTTPGPDTLQQEARTRVMIKNATDNDMQVAIVLAAMGGACGADHPPITADTLAALGFCSGVVESKDEKPYAGKCMLTLAANDSIMIPDLPNTCMSGNVTFGDYPSCPNAAYPDGFSTAEFTLNVASGLEAIDVSLVNGRNYQVNMSVNGGGPWTVQTTNAPITEIVPKALGNNTDNPGVYPENCTDCIRLVGTTVCAGFPDPPSCHSQRVCNVQRDVSQSGGTVTITLAGD